MDGWMDGSMDGWMDGCHQTHHGECVGAWGIGQGIQYVVHEIIKGKNTRFFAVVSSYDLGPPPAPPVAN
jgi:hypothetical protein